MSHVDVACEILERTDRSRQANAGEDADRVRRHQKRSGGPARVLRPHRLASASTATEGGRCGFEAVAVRRRLDDVAVDTREVREREPSDRSRARSDSADRRWISCVRRCPAFVASRLRPLIGRPAGSTCRTRGGDPALIASHRNGGTTVFQAGGADHMRVDDLDQGEPRRNVDPGRDLHAAEVALFAAVQHRSYGHLRSDQIERARGEAPGSRTDPRGSAPTSRSRRIDSSPIRGDDGAPAASRAPVTPRWRPRPRQRPRSSSRSRTTQAVASARTTSRTPSAHHLAMHLLSRGSGCSRAPSCRCCRFISRGTRAP